MNYIVLYWTSRLEYNLIECSVIEYGAVSYYDNVTHVKQTYTPHNIDIVANGVDSKAYIPHICLFGINVVQVQGLTRIIY